MGKAKIWMATASLAASAILLAAASGCAVVDPKTGAPTRSARFWMKAGAVTDRAGGTEPLNLPEARLTEDEPRGE